MKERKYLHCKVTAHEGYTFENPLKLSEAYLVSQLAQENKKVVVECRTYSAKIYKIVFGV